MLETFSLPNNADLKLICKSLAALDLIFVEEQYSFIRKFHYETKLESFTMRLTGAKAKRLFSTQMALSKQ